MLIVERLELRKMKSKEFAVSIFFAKKKKEDCLLMLRAEKDIVDAEVFCMVLINLHLPFYHT